MLNTLNGLFIAAVLAGTPLLLGALGEILTEKSGKRYRGEGDESQWAKVLQRCWFLFY